MAFVRNDPPLFSENELRLLLYATEQKIPREIDLYEGNRLLNTPIEDLARYFVDQFDLQPIELQEDAISTEQGDVQIPTDRLRDGRFMYGDHQSEVAGTMFSFFVPFKGDAELFGLQPSTISLNPPRASVRGQELVFSFSAVKVEAEAIRNEFNRQLAAVRQLVGSQAAQIADFRRRLPEIVRSKIDEKRQRLLAAQQTAAALGYPVRRRDGSPTTFAPPEVRRKITPRPPPASGAAFVPEPALAMEEYEHILDVMSNMALVLERSPSAFATMREEDLRQHFLVQLNGQYEGAATGETFNVDGKTDILIRHQGKNIFIAECKFWRGPSIVAETMDQLLSYLSWRDTKAAIVIFSRDTALSTVLAKIPDEVRKGQNFKREVPVSGEARFRAVLSHRNDPSRELIVTFLVFDVPSSTTVGP
jgi:hypothetical protein